MSTRCRIKRILTTAMLLSALTATVGTGASSAASWHFNGAELTTGETIVGDAILSSIAFPGLTNTCKKMLYEMDISNSAKVGKGEVTAFSFSTCQTDVKACTIEAIGAQGLPWPVKVVEASGASYLVIEEIEIGILYGGELCALYETEIPFTGSAGALYDNGFEVLTLSPTTFEATGTSVKVFKEPVEWNGTFATEATGTYAGQALTVS